MVLTSKFFTQNRAKLFNTSGVDLIVIFAHTLVQRSNDVTYPFRQNSNFFYLTGVNEPDVVLVMTKNETYLIMPEPSDHQKIFDSQHDVLQIQKQSGISEIHNQASGWKKLTSDITKYKSIGVNVGKTPDVHFQINEYGNRYKKLREVSKDKKFKDIRIDIARLRMVKQPEEIAQIQQAVDITLQGFNEIEKKLSKLKTERDIEAMLTAGFIQKGAVHGYPPIVGSGKAACTLHYVNNNQKLGGAQVLIDAGAEVNNYSADITRTFQLTKEVKQSKRFKEIYMEVVRLSEFAMSILKPGTTLKEYEEQVAVEAEKSIKKLKGKTAKLRDYYPHSTSHHLGLDVHDVADYSLPLEAGNVITVEPGIYITEEGIGVRIEDDVLITKTGIRVLS